MTAALQLSGLTLLLTSFSEYLLHTLTARGRQLMSEEPGLLQDSHWQILHNQQLPYDLFVVLSCDPGAQKCTFSTVTWSASWKLLEASSSELKLKILGFVGSACATPLKCFRFSAEHLPQESCIPFCIL